MPRGCSHAMPLPLLRGSAVASTHLKPVLVNRYLLSSSTPTLLAYLQVVRHSGLAQVVRVLDNVAARGGGWTAGGSSAAARSGAGGSSGQCPWRGGQAPHRRALQRGGCSPQCDDRERHHGPRGCHICRPRGRWAALPAAGGPAECVILLIMVQRMVLFHTSTPVASRPCCKAARVAPALGRALLRRLASCYD